MNWEPVSREMARRFGWINTSISGSRRSNCGAAARHFHAGRCPGVEAGWCDSRCFRGNWLKIYGAARQSWRSQ